MTTAIDLSQLPAPQVIETIDYETILAERRAYLVSLWPEEQRAEIAARLELESDPLHKILQESAYRELVLRQRINDSARSLLLAHATGADLDNLGANPPYRVARRVIDPGDSSAVPPRARVLEPDSEYRRRIALAPEGYTTAGSQMSYLFHALGADPDVLDASPVSPLPGVVTVYVLSRSGDGSADEALLAAVTAALNGESVRPMTDQVAVQSASIVTYSIEAELVIYPGPDASVVLAAAQAAAEAYAAEQHAMRRDVTLSGIYAALHQPGVMRVDLVQPTANLVIGDGEASHCTAIALTIAGATDV